MKPGSEILEEIALTSEEYNQIVGLLAREPNMLELGLFGALWSEHCGYKHSRPLLGLFPSRSSRVVVEAGAENAGAVDIGDGQLIIFKIESHNHPSAVEPFQGAATGVGGIVRDVLAMGARPIALLNSLRFGQPWLPRQEYLFNGVVSGISWYGNCIGIPDVGGELSFAPGYEENPIVNAMCVGIVRREHLISSRILEPGKKLLLVGAETGRDGIHGASGLASRTFEGERELRTTVQVGNPFLEKTLIESCLEALARFPEKIVGVQDLGAAGLTSATVECAGNDTTGIMLDVADVPRRELAMTPYEVMLSESQERMLVIVHEGAEEAVKTVFHKWDLLATVIGETTNSGAIEIFDNGVMQASVPIKHLVDAPKYRIKGIKSSEVVLAQQSDPSSSLLPKYTPGQILLRLLASPNIASRLPVYRQYDHQVLTNTVIPPGEGDAAVVLIRGTGKAIALTTDGNSRACWLDPFLGGALAVAEACRNISCVGGSPIALSDCLNFGNPERPEVYYQLEECIKGMSEACRVLDVPVVSGNVSLYNETGGQAIRPTPIVGGLGLLEDVNKRCSAGFRGAGDIVVLMGASGLDDDCRSLAASEFQEIFHGAVAGTLTLDLEFESRLQSLCREAISMRLLSSAHDCSDGGLAVTLAESCMLGGYGVKLRIPAMQRWDAGLFGEHPSRILVSVPEGSLGTLQRLADKQDVPLLILGNVDGDTLFVEGFIDISVKALEEVWRSGISGGFTKQNV